MKLLEHIRRHAQQIPHKTALISNRITLDYQSLENEIRQLEIKLLATGYKTIAVDMDNSPAWVIVDLACMTAGICQVPLPAFFSSEQTGHIIRTAGIEAIISDKPSGNNDDAPLDVAGYTLKITETRQSHIQLPADIVKVTFTSGTTADPKGVMLRQSQIDTVVTSLSLAAQASNDDHHLTLMPLAILLENLGGVYVALSQGACIHLPGLADVGLQGSVSLNPETLLNAIKTIKPSTLILSPHTLQILIYGTLQDKTLAQSLRFLALGGAPVSTRLLDEAESLGLPVFEGYGLSECASVVTLNTPDANRKGSVGRALPHIGIEIADDNEILIHGHQFAGYIGEPRIVGETVWKTGDLGYLDDQGYLYITGRKKHIFITSSGRNVSPEWIEKELVLEPEIMQAAIFGEARPFNLAIIVAFPDTSVDEVRSAIIKVNKLLPDYARIRDFILASEAFSIRNGTLTGTGRLRREAIFQQYQQKIGDFFLKEKTT